MPEQKSPILQTTYKAEKTLRSVYLSKSNLQSVESYVLQRARQLDPTHAEEERQLFVSIDDSSGETNFRGVETYPRSIFDNGITGLYMSYGHGLNPGALKVAIRFGTRKSLTSISVEYKGENPRELVESVIQGVDKQLRDVATSNYLYHASGALQYFGAMAIIAAAEIALASLRSNVDLSRGLFAIILFVAGYLYAAPRIKPYTTFDTLRNRSASRWSRWLVETILGALLVWILAWIAGSLHLGQ